MTAFFSRLIGRHLGTCDTVQPRMPGRFEGNPAELAEAPPAEVTATLKTGHEQTSPAPARKTRRNAPPESIHEAGPRQDKKHPSPSTLAGRDDTSTQDDPPQKQAAPSGAHAFSGEPCGMQALETPETENHPAPPTLLRQAPASKAPLTPDAHDIIDAGPGRESNAVSREDGRNDKPSSPASTGKGHPGKTLDQRIHVLLQHLAGDRAAPRNGPPLPTSRRENLPLAGTITPPSLEADPTQEESKEQSGHDGDRGAIDRYGQMKAPSPLPAMEHPLNRRAREAEASDEPVINVTIGRVEVRAAKRETPRPAPRPTTPSGVMTLDEYLKQREGGGTG